MGLGNGIRLILEVYHTRVYLNLVHRGVDDPELRRRALHVADVHLENIRRTFRAAGREHDVPPRVAVGERTSPGDDAPLDLRVGERFWQHPHLHRRAFAKYRAAGIHNLPVDPLRRYRLRYALHDGELVVLRERRAAILECYADALGIDVQGVVAAFKIVGLLHIA